MSKTAERDEQEKKDSNIISNSEIIEILDSAINKIPRSKNCVYSYVPEGRVWCRYDNKLLAGRCPSCDKYIRRVERI